MKANPELKVFVASGYFDLVSNYAANAYVANHLEPELRKNVTARTYGGGHAIYTDETAQLEMKRDVAEFIKSVVDGKTRSSERGRDTEVPSVSTEHSRSADDQIVTTRHQITLDNQIMTYTARAGLLPIRHNETGEARL